MSDIKIITDIFQFPFDEFQHLKLEKRPRKTKNSKPKPDILKIVTAFDIETTRIPALNQSVMYTWQWHFSDPLNVCVIGRTWDEWKTFISILCDLIPDNTQLIIYDHNLSYEFQFIRAFYDFQNDEVFAVRPRKILYCSMYDKLIFRDSYLHSNMSLKTFLSKMQVKHQKVSGIEFDYHKLRYSWTPLTDLEMQYICNDVIGLCEAIETELIHDSDTLYTIPLTSTGYVRRDAQRALYIESHFGSIPGILPDWKTYVLLREAFRGGDCHCSRYHAGATLKNVHSYDRSSSYPDVVCTCDYPIAPFVKVEGEITKEKIAEFINEHVPFICRCLFHNIRLRDQYWPDPYLSKSKCINVENPKIDNGRILKADSLQTTITDIDFQIILETYEFDDLYIPDCMTSKYGPLPRKLITLVADYYKMKTRLKGKKEQAILYEKFKNKINAIYGMMAQDPVREPLLYDNGDWNYDTQLRSDLLAKYNENAFLPYQWGVWTTSWARFRLFEGIKIVGAYNFVYCDTDSVKFIGEADFSKFNRRAIRWAKESGAAALDSKGRMHYIGEFEPERDYYRFRSWGAKKYAYQYEENGPTEATISGVVKVAEYDDKGEPVQLSGGLEIDKHGGLEAFKDGFVFREAGGLTPIYNDDDYGPYTIDGHTIDITRNICLVDTTYTVSVKEDYMDIIDESQIETLYRLGLPGFQES